MNVLLIKNTVFFFHRKISPKGFEKRLYDLWLGGFISLRGSFIWKKNSNISQKKTEKRKPFPQGRREGMSGFLLKILPEARGWRFLIKPAGLELDIPGRRLTFAFLFWFTGINYPVYTAAFWVCPFAKAGCWRWNGVRWPWGYLT